MRVPVGVALGVLLCRATLMAAPATFDPVKTFGADGAVRFELKELTQHPFYWWPRTLLSYPVRFTAPNVKPGSLALNSGSAVPFQLSGVRTDSRGDLQFAVVSFFSDLPSGGSRGFELTAKGTAPAATSKVKEAIEGASIVVDTGSLKVRIPASRPVQGEAPGPIMQAFRGGKWIGSSRIISSKRPVQRIETVREESGPLFVTYRVTYTFAGGGKYVARIRAVLGYDFVQLREEMKGLAQEDTIHWELSWTGLEPTHRAAPDHPFAPLDTTKTGWDRIRWERIDQSHVTTKHGVSPGISPEGELPFRLGMYEPWAAYEILTSATFWDERKNEAVGVFIDRVAGWQDHEYAIWWGADTLQVRYYFRDGVLRWRWPLVTGSRSTGIAAYDHRKDLEELERLESQWNQIPGTTSPHGRLFPMTYTHFLQNRHGTVDLDLVKDWVLEYPDGARRPDAVFREGRYQSVPQLERAIRNSELAIGMMACGTRQDSGFDPVAGRAVYDDYLDSFQRLWPQMTPDERKRLTAWYLMLSYVAAGEEWLPLQPMLAGHPNFLADAKSIPSLMAFLFPEHPLSEEWMDLFEKSLELNTRYHTRPSVESIDAKGGRWTESLGTYVWAFLRPTVRSEFALRRFLDGKNRLTMPNLVAIGDWLLNTLSAPFDGEDLAANLTAAEHSSRLFWGAVSKADAPRRVHPPQGAHAARRMAPRVLWWMGDSFRNYSPLLAEHLMWAARPTDDDMELPKTRANPWGIMYEGADNRGTNPHLRTAKYTGYGIVLRNAVDTPDEMSIHLQQIDEGPNYRWGIAAEGGNGVIYYYSRGSSYSHNGLEDVGDRPAQDTDFATNFGVWKDGRFKSIGRNVLERPLYDFGGLQYAEITPREGRNAYSWPEYKSRSVMAIGSDYIITYDDVFSDRIAHRFSWSTQKNEQLPFIKMVKGDSRSASMRASVETGEVRGVWYDGWGDAMAIISDRPNWEVTSTPFGAEVKHTGGTDLIFRNPDGIQFHREALVFEGTAGAIRHRTDKSWELALFSGKHIAAGGLELTAEGKALGVSATFNRPDEVRGYSFSPEGGTLRLHCAACNGATFYLNGSRQEVVRGAGGEIVITLPTGRARWQLSRGQPEPNAPSITGTVYERDAVVVYVEPVAGAGRFRIEVSEDGAQSWRPAGECVEPHYALRRLKDGKKYHVRATAMNEQQTSAPGPEYPIYATSVPPPHPDGLKIQLRENSVAASWGEVLGAREYRLYRRVKGTTDYQVAYSGRARQHTDKAAGVIPAFPLPGILANAFRPASTYIVYEYAVSALNGNGESVKSPFVTTDPASWLNWDPKPGEPFTRRSSYNSTNEGTPMSPVGVGTRR